jgi:two-component system, NtrC family, response regulator HydG
MDTPPILSKSVLLVEDNELDACLTYNVLQECGTKIAVEIASTAEEGLTKVRSRPYDLIICDYRLPGMDGFSFLKLAKRIRGDMPVILLTGYPSQDLEAQVIHHGSSTYLRKPVDAQTLSKVVRESLFAHTDQQTLNDRTIVA